MSNSGKWKGVLVCIVLLSVVPMTLETSFSQEVGDDMPHHEVEHWAQLIGTHVYHLLNTVGKYQNIEDNFRNQGASIAENAGFTLVKQMAEDVSNMMKHKVQAVKRIMNVAEEVSQDTSYLQDSWEGYYNAKMINREDDFIDNLIDRYGDRMKHYYGTRFMDHFSKLPVQKNSHFDDIAVSLNTSTVHVPTNVFEGGSLVIQAIRWSEALERTFTSNYDHDPTLSWQYFGSSYGFLRQYPGSGWQMDAEDPDLYDARLRPWYIQAANTPKDMIILLDVSGSMTGLRKEIAKHVVMNILDTLNENDFLNIFTFNESTAPLLPCFNDTLVQANLENIGEFKNALDDVKTENIANFSKALTHAFKVLQNYNMLGHGSLCNQAIMLVTDGAPYTYEKIFKTYNWPQLQIRVFTYLIGREVTDAKSLCWMACSNKGYFVHVKTQSEVREQVLKYIPVIARPMVMYRDKHPIVWSGVYADIADPKQTAWLWELRERERQRTQTINYRNLKRCSEIPDDQRCNQRSQKDVEIFLQYGAFLTDREVEQRKAENARKIRSCRPRRSTLYHNQPSNNINGDRIRGRIDRIEREQIKLDQMYEDIRKGRRQYPGSKFGYKMMTTVSVPVLNRTERENITERVLIDDSVWVIRSREEKVADLLGVAATDIPIREIEKLVPPYKLGVNGYSFMTNRNGFVLYHPDFRPTHEEPNTELLRQTRDKREWFQDILKPNYNSVDLFEVELPDASNSTRMNHTGLYTLRRDMIEQRTTEMDMRVRLHLDNMRRVEVRNQRYFTSKVSGTPYSLGISLPEFYGRLKVSGQIELSLAMTENMEFNATEFFQSGNWSLHPDWVYCEYKYDQGVDRTPEELMMHFLVKAQMPYWKWRSTRTRPPPQTTQSRHQPGHHDGEDYFCDKTLVQSLLFDAKATDVFRGSDSGKTSREDNNKGKYKNFGITNAFVATRSGLSRWIDLGDELGDPEQLHFMESHKNSIDEIWYKRAVDYYQEDDDAYVYSAPFDASTRQPSDVMITASRAIFIKQNKFQQAPAAVVGVNIKLDKFIDFFKNETYNCREYSRPKECRRSKTCKSDSLDCYLLDDSGFVVASEDSSHVGKFFGVIEGTIMQSLVQSEVFNRIRIYDYQAVCLDVDDEKSWASILMTPFEVLKWGLKWTATNTMWILVKTQLYHLWDPNSAWAFNQAMEEEYDMPINHDRPPIIGDDGGTPVDMDDLYHEKAANVSNTSTSISPESSEVDYDYDEYQDPTMMGPLDEPFPQVDLAYIKKTKPRPCDKEVDLYKLNNSKLRETNSDKFKPVKGKLSNCHSDGCGKPFSVQKVIKTNLVLIVVHNVCPCESRIVDIDPTEVTYSENETCRRQLTKNFRKRPDACFNYHPDEGGFISDCGGSSRIPIPSFLTITVIFVFNMFLTGRNSKT